MLSKNKIKFIQSLNRKKIRDQENFFLVEGSKMVLEAIDSGYQIELICATEDFLSRMQSNKKGIAEVVACSDDELKKASLLQNPQQALAVVQQPRHPFQLEDLKNSFSIALDFIQDPGNLGTIIRVADWFGIRHILCAINTVDCFNPKVIQASMGAIFRVSLHYTDLAEKLSDSQALNIPVFGTFLDGTDIYKAKLPENGILVMGNEGNGISPEVEKHIDCKIHIPSFALTGTGSESLNVGTATAICCSEFKRRTILR